MRIEDLWAKVPDIRCKGLCTQSCGPIDCSPHERQRVKVRHGFTIPTIEDASMDIAGGRVKMCRALKDGRCSIYEDRPLICRIWGVVESLKCPHGCVPEGGRWLTHDEGQALIRVAAKLPANQLLP